MTSVPPTQPPAAPETDASALTEAWSTRAAADGWLDPDGERLVGAAVNAIAWQLLEDSMDLADRDPSAEVLADAQDTAHALLADPSAARERVRVVEAERDGWRDRAATNRDGWRQMLARAESAEAAHRALQDELEALAAEYPCASDAHTDCLRARLRARLRALLAGGEER